MQYFGFTVTPVLGAVVAAVGGRNRFTVPLIALSVSEYSLPALFLGCLAACNAAVLFYLFDDKTKFVEEREQEPKPLTVASSSATTASDYAPIASETDNATEGSVEELERRVGPFMASVRRMKDAKRVIIGGCLLNVAMKGTIGVFETLGAEIVTRSFHWDSMHAGYTFASFGFFGVFCLLSFPLLQALGVLDVDLIAGGAVMMTLSCFLRSVERR